MLSRIKDFEENGKLEVLEKSSKRGDRFTAISDLQKNEERAFFQAGNRELIRKFSKQVYCPKVPKIFFSQGTRIHLLFLQTILEDFDLRGKVNIFENP